MAPEQPLSTSFGPDEIPGYERLSYALPREDDGALWATLVRKRGEDTTSPLHERPAVLYLHGFCDYFFQTHLCDAIESAGYRFYALELRRYGRSIAPGNRPNQARDISDYFLEIDWAIDFITKRHPYIAGAVAHSTGGLILSHYFKQPSRHFQHTDHQRRVRCLVLNSPFLKFNLPRKETALVKVVAAGGHLFPYYELPQKISGGYGKSLHKSQMGEWDYNLNYKPLYGFPFYPMWFRMIARAQAVIPQGLGLTLPIFAMRSSRSKFPSDPPGPDDFFADTVLNVDHIRELAPLLGQKVEPCIIESGLHDLYLSNEISRATALRETLHFIGTHQNS
jgi:alpha-beta hydrolase superfamily lysophospholipase